MPGYRLYRLVDDHIASAVDFDAADDSAALRHGRRLAEGDFELWSGRRKVEKVLIAAAGAAPLAEAPSARVGN